MKRLDKKRGKEKKDRKMGIMKKTDSPGPYPFFILIWVTDDENFIVRMQYFMHN